MNTLLSQHTHSLNPAQAELLALALMGTLIFWTDDDGLMNEGVVVEVVSLFPAQVVAESLDGSLWPVK